MPQLTEQQQQAIEAAVLGGKKIEAIKLFRDAVPGTGLKEAKDWVEELERQMRLKQPEKFSALPKKAGCLGVVATLAIILIVFLVWTFRARADVWSLPLIDTLLQRGVEDPAETGNRFNGFRPWVKTVETVSLRSRFPHTPLKQGVNEKAIPATPT